MYITNFVVLSDFDLEVLCHVRAYYSALSNVNYHHFCHLTDASITSSHIKVVMVPSKSQLKKRGGPFFVLGAWLWWPHAHAHP